MRPIAGYEAFRTAADAVKEGDFPELVQLDDGGVVALRLDEVVPPTLRPYDEVRDDVATAWRADALAKALSARAIEVKSAVEGGAPLGSFGIVDTTLSIARDGFIENAPDTLLPAVFADEPGELRVIEGPDFVGRAAARRDPARRDRRRRKQRGPRATRWRRRSRRPARRMHSSCSRTR